MEDLSNMVERVVVEPVFVSVYKHGKHLGLKFVGVFYAFENDSQVYINSVIRKPDNFRDAVPEVVKRIVEDQIDRVDEFYYEAINCNVNYCDKLFRNSYSRMDDKTHRIVGEGGYEYSDDLTRKYLDFIHRIARFMEKMSE